MKKENGLVRHISFDSRKYTVEDVANTVADAFDDTEHHAHQATLIYLNYRPRTKE